MRPPVPEEQIETTLEPPAAETVVAAGTELSGTPSEETLAEETEPLDEEFA